MCEVASLLLKVYNLLQKKPVVDRNVLMLKEWCLPLARLLCSSAPDDEQREAVIKIGDDLAHDIYSQTFRASEIQQSEGCLLTENISELQSPDSEYYADLEALLSLRYQLGELLRSGHFSFVYKAVRIADKKKVTVKVVTKYIPLTTTKMPGVTEELPTEVALMMMASKPPVCSNIVELLEWFDEGSQFILVLELSSPCMDLMEFQKLQKGFLSESQARDIMVQALCTLHLLSGCMVTSTWPFLLPSGVWAYSCFTCSVENSPSKDYLA
ncbi:serine/threonine-protein kinase pim-2-like [Tachysurus fulvidraco]|uniref:serine/threonine-protein kinase pim-2-like n=1 Tax=Tachysurus fulvidraco TaxID=1234273 RepID=UPI001FF04CA8|nr:serine/threonine-protein kinase pim-2-like [Tachysurus fulvidraco]